MRTRTLALAAGLATAAAAIVIAGPLDPPAGPVAPTFKTLAEVEPRTPLSQANTPGDADSVFRITQPGSYYLTGDLITGGPRNGIEIAASSVTLDLSGFSITGQGAFSGIKQDLVNLSNIHVRNGAVEGFGTGGVYLFSPQGSTSDGSVQNVNCLSNQVGIFVGRGFRITGCSTRGGGSGILTDRDAVITNCTARDHFGNGLVTGQGSTVENCTATGNGSGGNGAGILVGNGSIVRGCVSEFNLGTGITILFGSLMSECTIRYNDTYGVTSGDGCTITRCTVTHSGYVGINVQAGSQVTDNVCMSNGRLSPSAGISTTQASINQARIERNHCSANSGPGIRVQGADNFVFNNTCSFNTPNYVIAAGNRVGTIVVPPASAAINGNSGGGSGTTDPFANFAR